MPQTYGGSYSKPKPTKQRSKKVAPTVMKKKSSSLAKKGKAVAASGSIPKGAKKLVAKKYKYK